MLWFLPQLSGRHWWTAESRLCLSQHRQRSRHTIYIPGPSLMTRCMWCPKHRTHVEFFWNAFLVCWGVISGNASRICHVQLSCFVCCRCLSPGFSKLYSGVRGETISYVFCDNLGKIFSLIWVFQFNSVYLYSPFSQIINLAQSALQSVHIDIPVPKPHIGSGKTPKQPLHHTTGRAVFLSCPLATIREISHICLFYL